MMIDCRACKKIGYPYRVVRLGSKRRVARPTRHGKLCQDCARETAANINESLQRAGEIR